MFGKWSYFREGVDNVDYAEYKLNYRLEAAQASTATFITKVATGLSGAIPGYVLGWAGYVANSQQQPASAITAIIMLVIVIPTVFFLAAALTLGFGYNLDKSLLQKVEETLSERRAAKLTTQH
jgi:Na+/melibiose symporter-like transporter